MKTLNGFTLLELLITLAITSILLGAVFPSFANLIEKNRINADMHELHKTFTFARSTALDRKETIFICGSNAESTCDKFWTKNLLVFIDYNDDKIPDADEIIKIKQFDLKHGKYKSRMSARRTYTKFLANGMTSGAGTVIYCPEDFKATKYRRMTWNRIGRIYRASDSDGNGIVEDWNGKELVCD